MARSFTKLFIFLVLFIHSEALHAQFIKQPFRFDSPIVSILEKDNKLFLATQRKGIYVSSDRGKTWENRWYDRFTDYTLYYGDGAVDINSIAFSGNRLLAATSVGIFISDNEAISWRRINKPEEYISPAINIYQKPEYTSSYRTILAQGTTIYAIEQFFDPVLATYGSRVLVSTNQGENWRILFYKPNASVLGLGASKTDIYIGGKDNTRWDEAENNWLIKSSDNGATWKNLAMSSSFGFCSSIKIDNTKLLVTSARPWKDSYGSIAGTIINCATSTDAGLHWQSADFPIEDGSPANATLIHNNLFIVALHNKIAYSNGTQWQTDSAGIWSPNAYPEGGLLSSRDTLWVGYQNMRLQSDQYALKGYLLSRPMSDFSPDRLLAPALLEADDRLRNLITLSWQPIRQGAVRYVIERSDKDNAHFRPIATVQSTDYTDTRVINGMTYYYRLRTETADGSAHSLYTPPLKVYKPQNCLRIAYLNRLEDIHMPSRDTLFARDGSEIVRSIDGGKSWSELNPCSFASVRYEANYGKFIALSFPTARIGYALVGNGSYVGNGMMLKTKDGGESWVIIRSKPDISMMAILFVNETTGFGLVSDSFDGGNLLYKTTDSGQTFTVVPNAPRLRTLKRQNGLLVGQNGEQNLSFSADGGNTWTQVKQNAYSPYIFSTKRFLVVGRSYYGDDVRQTIDGGLTWTVLPIPLREGDRIHNIQFVNENVGFLLGGPRYGTDRPALVYRTTDGGKTWKAISTPHPIRGEATELTFNGTSLFLVCEPNKTDYNLNKTTVANVLSSSDLGATWQFISDIYNDNDYLTKSISFRNAREGIQLTMSTEGIYNSFYYQTNDGGINWLKKNVADAAPLWQVKFINATNGFLIGANAIYYTSTGGQQWIKRTINAFSVTRPPEQHSYPSSDYLIAHGGYFQFLFANYWVALSDDDRLYASTTQGQTWQLIQTPPLRKPEFYFLTDKIGYITSLIQHGNELSPMALLFKTTDGGLSWQPVGPTREKGLYFLTEAIGFIGTTRTADGGKTWRSMDDLRTRDYLGGASYQFIDKQTGYAGGKFITTDAGETWLPLDFIDEASRGSTYFVYNSSLLASDQLYGIEGRKIVPNAAPCNPILLTGDSLVQQEQKPSTSYIASSFGWRQDMSYEWALSGGGTLNAILDSATVRWDKATSVKTHTLSVRASNDCGLSAPLELAITVKILVTAVEPALESVIRVYPNPATNCIQIIAPPFTKLQTVRCYQQDGKEIPIQQASDGTYLVDHLPAGIYFMRIVLNNQIRETKRILISR